MRQRVTHYDILGVERDATEAQIRRAFRKLTLDNHPDRFSGDARLRAEERFQEITEAFNILNRPDSREKYDREISSGTEARTMDRAEIARRLAAKGAQALRDGHVTDAVEQLRLAVDHDDTSARAHYFLGLTYSRINGRDKDAFRHLERAVMLEPNNPTMKGEAAALALVLGLKARAVRLAQQALSLDPTNSKASQVLASADDDGGSQSEGLLGRFRRRS